MATAYLNVVDPDRMLCLLCETVIGNEKKTSFGNKGWDTLKEQAKKWSTLKIPRDDKSYAFTKVYEKIENLEIATGFAHNTCRIKFRTKCELFQKKYGVTDSVEERDESSGTEMVANRSCNRRSLVLSVKSKQMCFICNEKRVSDDEYPYNQGGLARCCEDASSKRLLKKMEEYLSPPNHRWYNAALRLQMILAGEAHDIYAADIFYHQSCYIKFALKPAISTSYSMNEEHRQVSQNILEEFYSKVSMQILHKKSAFLLSMLLKDLECMSEEQCVQPAVNDTKSLKRKLNERFGEDICFYSTGRQVIVYSSDINPCQYSVTTLKGYGLRDYDLVKAFGNLIRRKLQHITYTNNFPFSISEAEVLLRDGPIKELYNVIYSTINPNFSLSEDGYAITPSHQLATKIWSMASDWESLLIKKISPKQLVTGLTLHRSTGSKEAISALHKMNHTVSYADIRKQNAAWAEEVKNGPKFPLTLKQGIATHFTLDNNDGNQETATGKGTTHDTNMTIFQPILKGESFEERRGEESIPVDDFYRLSVPDYELGTRKPPSLFPEYEDNESQELLNKSFKRDVLWALVQTLCSAEEGTGVGSWTCFNKNMVEAVFDKSLVEYLPTIPQPPEYDVCKKSLDDLRELIDFLDVNHVFAHADEQVYAKLCHIIWKEPAKYNNIIIMMGGFHQLRVRQKTIYKRYACLGFKNWFVDAGIIAAGSADMAMEGRHYYRNMRLLKESFNALIQFRTQNALKMNEKLCNDLRDLKADPCKSSEESILESPQFNSIYNEILNITGTQGEMTVTYLKDVSTLLSLIRSVREGDFNLHMEAQREMLKFCFAFNHVNYARYLSYQHVYFTRLEAENHPAIFDLRARGIGGSLTGSNFSSIHGDLITEVFNGQTKRQAGPHRSGYSTNIESVNNWVETTHVHAKLKETLNEKIKLSTNTVHKESTDKAKKLHDNHIKDLILKLQQYGHDPFNGVARDVSTGKEIDQAIVNDMIAADKVGNELFKVFVKERLQQGTVAFFSAIKKCNLKTGLKKQVKVPATISSLKEDRQAFGLLLENGGDLEDSFKYPITTFPLSLSTPDGNLRQSQKSLLRNYMIDQANAVEEKPPQNARWLFDGMAILRQLKSKETFRQFFDCLLKVITPSSQFAPISIELVNDMYFEESTKCLIREKRGNKSKRTHIQSFDQKMLQGKEWFAFFNNIENKTELLKWTVSYLSLPEVREKYTIPLITNNGFATLEISKDSVTNVFRCNHEEADTRLILHALEQDTNVVVVSKDTDVFVLLVYAYAKLKPVKEWYMKIDSNRYVNIGTVVDHFGDSICERLPHIHSITGCDTTSYLHGVGKVKVVKKLKSSGDNLEVLLDGLGNSLIIYEQLEQRIFKFVQMVCYAGIENETYVQTRVRMYKKMKIKSSMTIPPDPSSLKQHILRSNFQLFEWLRFSERNIPDRAIIGSGWTSKEEDGDIRVVPIWYEGPKMPVQKENTHLKKKRKVAPEAEVDEEDEILQFIYFSDSDESDTDEDSEWEP